MQLEAKNQPVVKLPTPVGDLDVRAVEVDGKVLLVASSAVIPDVPIVRFQSSCVFGEAFGAVDCDCGAQLTAAQSLIGDEGGILVYAWEEGRGAGIVDKLRAIKLQQTEGLSTAQAFDQLGHRPDPRTFAAHIYALRQVFSGSHIRLASSNPRKIEALEAAGFKVERVKLVVPMNPARREYLDHKQSVLGHLDDGD